VIVSNVLERMPERENMVQREQLKSPSVSRFVQLEKPGLLVFLEEQSNRCESTMGFGDFHAIETTKAECLGIGVEETNGNIPVESNQEP
jgi:hypothetical protein